MSVFDVAKYILEQKGRMSTWKLQKLVYYSEAWSLVWDEKSLFDDDFEAWANGPVTRSLFNAHKGRLYIEADALGRGDSTKLGADARETIDAVVRDYGDYSGQELSEIAHSERPWKEARGETPAGESSTAIIDRDAMMDYYAGLLQNAQRA